MELFPAANEDQWSLIKDVIDDCDYYIVVVAGRYGSIGASGASFTEMEYDYAVSKGKPTIGFVHKEISKIPSGKCDKDPKSIELLEKFREKLKRKVVRFWESPAELGSVVSRSLIKLIKSHPTAGWVRGDNVPEGGAAAEILRLRRELDEAVHRSERERYSPPEGSEGLAQDDAEFEFELEVNLLDRTGWHAGVIRWREAVTWNEIFSAAAPSLIDEASSHKIESNINDFIASRFSKEISRTLNDYKRDGKIDDKTNIDSVKIYRHDFDTAIVQLRELGLIDMSGKKRSLKDTNTYWTLTKYGDFQLNKLRAIRKPASAESVFD